MIKINCPSRTIQIESIDEKMFTTRCYTRCLDLKACNDDCCSYGCPVDLWEKQRILIHKEALEAKMGIPATKWFNEKPEDFASFPSGQIDRTKVYDGKCVFHDNKARGCYLQKYALEKNVDPHFIKPMICFMFPLTWDQGEFYVSEFLDELPCKNKGSILFNCQKEEIRYYFGKKFLSELEYLKKARASKQGIAPADKKY